MAFQCHPIVEEVLLATKIFSHLLHHSKRSWFGIIDFWHAYLGFSSFTTLLYDSKAFTFGHLPPQHRFLICISTLIHVYHWSAYTSLFFLIYLAFTYLTFLLLLLKDLREKYIAWKLTGHRINSLNCLNTLRIGFIWRNFAREIFTGLFLALLYLTQFFHFN